MPSINFLLTFFGLAITLIVGVWIARNPVVKGEPWSRKRKLMAAVLMFGAALLILNFVLHFFF